MNMKKLALASGALLMGASALAQAEVSGNVALGTDYIFRGVSQTDNSLAISGGFDYAHDSGFYAGTWASNVDSTFFVGAEIEWDLYLGWSGEFNGVGVDVGALAYIYPESNPSQDTYEYHIGVSKDFEVASVGYTINYSDDWFNLGDALYHDFGVEVPAGPVTIAAHYGITDIDTTGADYEDFSLGASTEYGGIGFDLTYTGTSGDASSGPLYGDHVTFTISKAL